MYINSNYDDWRMIVEQAKEKSNITAASLKSTGINGKSLKSAMYSVLDADGYTSTTKRDLDVLFKVFPNIGDYLIKKENIKNLYQYYEKAGQHQINLSNLPEGGSSPQAKWLYTYNGNVVLISGKGSDRKILLKSTDDFFKWYHSTNLKRWSENKNLIQLSAIAENQFVSHGIKIITGVKTGGKGMNASRLGAKPVRLYTLKKGKKEVEYAVYVILGNKSITEYEGGEALYKLIESDLNLSGKSVELSSLKQTYFPYMILGYQSDVMKENNVLTAVYADSSKVKTKHLKLATPPKNTNISKDTIVHSPKVWEKPGGFDIGKFKVEDSKEASDFLQEIIGEIKEYAKGKDKVTIGNIVVTSSASNYYGGRVYPTHNNDGSAISKPKQGDPHPEADKYTDLKGAEANSKLAYLRGKNFSTALKKELDKLEGIEVTGKIVFNWRITDTGGVNDNKRDKKEYPNVGQYVKVEIKASGTSTKVKKEPTPAAQDSGKVDMIKLSSVSVTFAPAPGILRIHPNQQFASLRNAIQSIMGIGGTTTATVVQKAKEEGA